MEPGDTQKSMGYDLMSQRLTILARAHRERERTAPRNTVASLSRWWIIAIGLVLAACGGGGKRHGDMYAKGDQAQSACCEHLTGGERDQCLGGLVRANDPSVASYSSTQDVYACVAENFVCDPATGHATQASAQSQLDCIQDLGQ